MPSVSQLTAKTKPSDVERSDWLCFKVENDLITVEATFLIWLRAFRQIAVCSNESGKELNMLTEQVAFLHVLPSKREDWHTVTLETGIHLDVIMKNLTGV